MAAEWNPIASAAGRAHPGKALADAQHEAVADLAIGLQAHRLERAEHVAVVLEDPARLARVEAGGDAILHDPLHHHHVDAWTAELVPGPGAIAAFTFAADGALWLVNDRLLHRSPAGAWRREALPPSVAASDLRSVVPVADELWLVSEASLDDRAIYSLYRSGPASAAIDLDTGKPLRP